ncbi:hypothetical protein OEZ86_011880 [Tetradesmus obliquus]|nr:hypothetical protein OEZ86_011880 [Tetradesmus obliquus]
MAYPGLVQRPIFICDNDRLVTEASSSVFAQRNHISPAGIRHLWNGLSNFINVSLKSHKGVLLPALGTFAVGQALEDRYATYKRYRPTFSLLEGRFGGVSQENSKFRLLSRAAVAQLNYQLISQDAQIHRSIAQRLLSEILQRLATHIVSGHAIKVVFPSVGQLVRNRAGRIEFVFDRALVEALELGLGPGNPSWNVGYEVSGAGAAMNTAAATAGTAAREAYQPAAGAPQQQQYLQQQQPLSQQQSPQQQPGRAGVAPPQLRLLSPSPQVVNQYMESLQTLMKLCKQCDRTGVGAVPRAQLEGWLQSHCRPLLAAVDGATMLDMLLRHTYGTTGRFVQYMSFLQDLEEVVLLGPEAAAASAAAGPEAQEAAAAAAYPSAAGSPAGAAAQQQQQQAQPLAWLVQQQQGEDEQVPQQQQVEPAYGGEAGLRHQLPRRSDQAVPPLLLFDDEAAAAGGDAACVPGLGPEPVPMNHYLQNMISPRSRSEYDEFNRFHFSRIKQQGRDKRAITPKVGEEPMNRTEAAAYQQEMRSPRVSAEVASRARSPELALPSNKVDHVADILQLEGRPDRRPVQDRLFPAVPSDQASLYSRPASKGMRGMGASYDFGSRDHIFEQGLM